MVLLDQSGLTATQMSGTVGDLDTGHGGLPLEYELRRELYTVRLEPFQNGSAGIGLHGSDPNGRELELRNDDFLDAVDIGLERTPEAFRYWILPSERLGSSLAFSVVSLDGSVLGYENLPFRVLHVSGEHLFRRAAIVLTLGLSALVCLALFARTKVPLISFRVVAGILIVVALLASPVLVSIAAGPLPKLGTRACADPSLPLRWGPAVIAGAVGLAYSTLVLKRVSRRVLVALAIFLGMYGVTWWPGVPLVRSQLRDAAGEELRRFGRELWPGATAAKLAQIDREAESLRVDVYRAVPVFPALLWVEYSDWIPRGVGGSRARVVIWAGPRSRFLSYMHPKEFGLAEERWVERWVPESIHPVVPVAVLSIVGMWIACDSAIWAYRRRRDQSA